MLGWIRLWIPPLTIVFILFLYQLQTRSIKSHTNLQDLYNSKYPRIPVTNRTLIPLIYQSPKPWNPTTGRGFPYQVKLFQYSFWDRLLSLVSSLSFLSKVYPRHPPLVRYESIELNGGIVSVGEYYIQIKIGGTPFRVQVDTGSSTLAVPMEGCVSCRKTSSKYSSHLQSKSSIVGCNDPLCSSNICEALGCSECSSSGACCANKMPQACGFFLRYGDGSGAEGALLVDQVQVGNASFVAHFGGILEDTTNFEQSSVDGILGMGYPALGCTPSCIEPLIDSMFRQSKIEQNMFSLCISVRGGHLVLGGYDSNMAASNITFVPMILSSPPTFYAVSLGGSIRVDNEELSLDGFDKGIVDSGTTLLVISEQAFIQLKNYLQTHYCQVPGLCDYQHSWFDSASCVILEESHLQHLPTLTIHVANRVDLILTPYDYMLQVQRNGFSLYCLGIQSLPSKDGSPFVILGNTVMTKYLTIFDRRNHRIGFALAGDCQVVGCERYDDCETCSLDESCAFHIPSGTCQPREDSHSIVGIYPSCMGRLCFCKVSIVKLFNHTHTHIYMYI
ncbi:aspartyl protease [Galdieria sulphuraria]|uniref:Aspartyl protease n=1 Tax=Galdieria sulphuraria TaxID=130081 RepID=M2WV00_GALSU|nr:aspartyl protease [Galdieria sulphuraria]EME27790.1 aspartyl protease [Galdieria sulphuraria]|eukprot:XP_005704310.1 aspartyl protease [Galdieria sulphuraria]